MQNVAELPEEEMFSWEKPCERRALGFFFPAEQVGIYRHTLVESILAVGGHWTF